jgi:hypothetical protein
MKVFVAALLVCVLLGQLLFLRRLRARRMAIPAVSWATLLAVLVALACKTPLVPPEIGHRISGTINVVVFALIVIEARVIGRSWRAD